MLRMAKKKGLFGMPTQPSRALGLALKDTDKDGVPDGLDCQPRNPKKQGIIHTIGKRLAKKAGAKRTEKYFKTKERESAEWGAEKAEIRKQIRKEKYKAKVERATIRREERGKRYKEYLRGGGLMGAVGRGAKAMAEAQAEASRAKPKSKKKGKTRKRAQTKVVYVERPRKKKPQTKVVYVERSQKKRKKAKRKTAKRSQSMFDGPFQWG